jgi:tryptophan synthase alpha chain
MRLQNRFEELRREGRKALSLFVTAGYPSIRDTVPLVLGLAEAGADLIELGIPFSDPVADGPTIQRSSEVALSNGVTLRKTLELARRIRARSDVPLILMGYANPIYAYGLTKFLAECSDIGIDGTIIADLPPEESELYVRTAKEKSLASIFLAAPTTSPARLARLDEISTGFLYCVSITGVTGARRQIAGRAREFLQRARATVKKNPLLVGFGISTPEDARRIAGLSDGVVVGSALIKALGNGSGKALDRARRFTRQLRRALDSK